MFSPLGNIFLNQFMDQCIYRKIDANSKLRKSYKVNLRVLIKNMRPKFQKDKVVKEIDRY